MIDFLQITNDPVFARRCDAVPGMRLFVDLETHGKIARQAGRNTFISTHQMEDVGRVKAQLQRAPLMVRVNPLHAGSACELDAVLAQGADLVMLPMFHTPEEIRTFSRLLAGRVPMVALLETAQALRSIDDWIETPGLWEVFVGLNDLHLSLGCRFMFEPLGDGVVDHVAQCVRTRGLRFGFGGIARLDEGLLSGRDVLAEHIRLGSQAVILSRTFHRSDAPDVVTGASFERQIEVLRQAEQTLLMRSNAELIADKERIRGVIGGIAATVAQQRSAEGVS